MKSTTMRNIGYTLLFSFMAFSLFCFWQLTGTKTTLIIFGTISWIVAALAFLITAERKKIDEEYEKNGG